MIDQFIWKTLAIILGLSTLVLGIVVPSWFSFFDVSEQTLQEVELDDSSLDFQLFHQSEGGVLEDPSGKDNSLYVENKKGNFGAIFQSEDEVKEHSEASLDPTPDLSRLEYLLTQLIHPDWATRLNAVEALEQLNNPIVIPSLVDRILQDVSTHVRWRSIESLKGHTSYRNEIVSLLLEGLQDSQAEVQKNAAVALALYGNEEITDHLIDMLQDQADIRRREAAFVFGELGSDEMIEHLYPLLDQNLESNENVREEVVKVIGRIGNSESVPYLLEVLGSDVGERVRIHSAVALGNLGDATILDQLEQLYLNEQSVLVSPHIKASINRLN